ncbi:hypothetical protein EMIHUDRAFT_228606 [Emiliania huxleyi CCMP1516]|uniref:MYND-type domain-containing protein n=2 Tax=Emiliania huxleyi TaxID=2903 RepID=A0A0D3KF99_EMIH1|nr:hypothetical protein EMIHUDRAFT_228606 [Emiliania huxleyi CCMP1516]EOD34434.1 hypothetical protein EMIHUDRAFT_228606 [Emiliania huxleyi CCMP1516]|eukprot:XP_005786863.1 hypothetical protein EMIHUDRAFT_228606 [Emiliania huxleyi CCMP1516]
MCAAYTCRTSPDWRGSHLVASCHIPAGAVLLTEAPAATTCGDDESESVEAALAKALLESGRGSDWAARFAAPQQRGGATEHAAAAPPISDEALRRLCASGVDEVAALAVYDAVRHNAFGLETPLLGVEHGAAFYETAAKLNHSCDPNCLSTRLGGNFALFAVAAIEEGSELFHSYLPPRLLVLPRRARRAHLHFPCRCSRCEAEPEEPPSPLAQLGWPAAHAATAEGHLVGRFSLLCAGGAPREVVAAGAGLLSNAPLVSTLRQRPLAALQVCLPLLASSWQARAMGGADAAADDEGGWLGGFGGGGRDAAPPACLRCSRCKGVLYCSAVCQRADWPSHRNHCTPVAAVSGSDAAAAGISRLSESEDDGGEDDEVDVPIRRVGAGGGADTETLEQSWERMQASVASGRAQRLDVQYEVLQR